MIRYPLRVFHSVFKKLTNLSGITKMAIFSRTERFSFETTQLRKTRFACNPKFVRFVTFLVILTLAGGIGYGIYYWFEKSSTPIKTGEGEGAKPGEIVDIFGIRLPDTLIPLYYKLELIPFLEPELNFTLEGKVWIDVKCVRDTSQITLHTKNLTVYNDSVTVTQIKTTESPAEDDEKWKFLVEGHDFCEKRDFYTISLSPSLMAGNLYRIYIPYTGKLDDSMTGFYRSSYVDKITNETRYLGATQFEATYARKAFPCFDEPALKAKFEVTIARRQNMSTISNMQLARTEAIPEMDGWVWDHYQKSVPMSPYLLAVVVSDFPNVTSPGSKPEFRVWAQKGALNQTQYAREIGPKLLTFFEKYFDLAYPLEKQDLIALPDFGPGAMENWGLITFKESSLLYDNLSCSDDSQLYTTTVISHELSHQWFGNLVTPKWWNDLWLNEGFAAYTELIGAQEIAPEWKVMEYFVVDKIHESMRLDVLDSSHPISVPVYNPSEIFQLFDFISYRKGASIIRMMNHVLTNKSYRKGLHNYLSKWSYQAVDQNDLWDALTLQAHKDGTLPPDYTVASIMNSWTLQKGFPVVTVTRNYSTGSVTLSQAKFVMSPNASREYDSYLWWIPVSYASPQENANFSSTAPQYWLSAENRSLQDLKVIANQSSWVICNVQQVGFYRVNYDQQNWQLILDQLYINHTLIHTVNRAQIINDVFNLAQGGLMEYGLALNISIYLDEDDEYLPWESFKREIGYLRQMLCKTSAYGTFQVFVQELVEEQRERWGFSEVPGGNETVLWKRHRQNILQLACMADKKECLEQAEVLFGIWRNSTEPDNERSNPILPNLRVILYCTAIKHGGLEEWEWLWERYLKCESVNHKRDILAALVCSKEEWVLRRLLEWATTGEEHGIRKQDGASVIKVMGTTVVGSGVVFNYLRGRWKELVNHFGISFGGLGSIFKFVVSTLNTPQELQELEQFKVDYADHLEGVTRGLDQAIETLRDNVRWMDKNYKTVSQWLENQVRIYLEDKARVERVEGKVPPA